uniref:Dolichyl-diphosphooligosaccharide--protein glycosyltransferase subunit 2 n=1 Tax=Lutzomyia longipalpis TaxID=7200 RepID=A0A1B0CEI4_LUTLO
MRQIYCLLFLILHLWCCAADRTTSSYLSPTDERLQRVFLDGVKSSDLQTIYYSVLNYGSRLSSAEKEALCSRVKSLHAESKLNEFEKNFYLIGIHAELKCSTPVPSSIISTLESALAKDATTAPEVYFNFFAAKAAGIALDDAAKLRAVKNLQAILKKDDSLSNLGHAFAVAAEAGGNGVLILDRVEDAIAQADEVDGKMLQFEGGLSITALVLSGALKLTAAQKKPHPITPVQATKFATYFLSRRSVQTAKGAHVLLDALTTLNQQKGIAPICVQVIGNGQLQPEDLQVNFRVVDLLGNAVSPALDSITASVTAKPGSTSVAKDVKLTLKGSDKTVFALDLKQAKPGRGLYVADLTAGTFKQTVELKILGRVKVASLEVGIGDSDSSSAVKKQSVTYPDKLSSSLSADSQQKVVMKVSLVDEVSGKPISVHQAFVRFENAQTGEEIVFVAEQDTSKAYKFDMDVGARSSDFSHTSGKYQMELIVGDASLSNSFRWHVANINLKFPQDGSPAAAQESVYKPKKEIVHQFRAPEKRPARFVSDLFTGICCIPLLILFILWIRLRVNISNFPFSLSAIGFHVGLGAILFLFFVFWVQLDMFTTIRYLLPLALFTFLCGNRLLRSLAAKRTAHEKTRNLCYFFRILSFRWAEDGRSVDDFQMQRKVLLELVEILNCLHLIPTECCPSAELLCILLQALLQAPLPDIHLFASGTVEEFDTVTFEKNLGNLKDTQESISSLSSWCLQWRSHHKKIVSSWLTVLKQVKVEHRLTLFYLANDVIQYSKRNNYEFVESWGTTLQRATTMVRDEKVKNKILRIFKIWEQRGVYNDDFIGDLVGLLNMPPPAKKNQTEAKENVPEVEDPQTTALIANIRDCVKLQERTDKSFKNLSKTPQVDIENIKQNLKDRSHVEDVEKELEDCLTHLEAYMTTLKAEIKARGILITALVQADEFYHNQRGDVKTVAIAYRNFGNRVKTMKKKLEELTPTLPSPIPSPDINAPSPEPDGMEFDFPGSGGNFSNGFMSYMDSGALPFDINDFHRDSHTSRMAQQRAEGGRSSAQQIQVIGSHGSSKGEVDYGGVSDIFKNIINDTSPPSGYIPSLEPPQPVPPVGGNSLPPYMGGSSADTETAYNPGLDLGEFNADNNYGSGYGPNSGPSNYAAPSIVPPPVPPPIAQNPMEAYGRSWGGGGHEWMGNNAATGYDHGIETPTSPPHFDRKPSAGDTGMLEYDENAESSSAGDIDHRQLNLPSELHAVPPKVKNRAVDVDHRNLISLTGSPGAKVTTEKDIPPPPVAPPLLWPPKGQKDVDLRQPNTPAGNERKSSPAEGEGGPGDEVIVPPPLPPALIPLDLPPSFGKFFKEPINADGPPLLPDFQTPPPGFVVPPPPNSAAGKKNQQKAAMMGGKNAQNGPDIVESVDMEMSDEDMEEYHNTHEEEDLLEREAEEAEEDEELEGQEEMDEMDGGMQNNRGGPRGMPPMPFMGQMNFAGHPPLLPTPPGGPPPGNWNGPPAAGGGGNFPRGGGFFGGAGGERMRGPQGFPMQGGPLFNFRPGMNMRGNGRPPLRGRPHPFRTGPLFRGGGGGGGGNRGRGRGGKWMRKKSKKRKKF